MLLIPNIGADAGLARPDAPEAPAAPDLFQQAADFADPEDPVLQTAVLWQTLFAEGSRFALVAARASQADWPAELGERAPGPVFEVVGDGAAAAWINTPAARRIAQREGLDLLGAEPDVVRAVHDKAFAQRAARDAELQPAELRELIDVLDPDALRDADAARRRIVEAVARWPDWTGRRFTLKPRFGSSGRGRIAGVGDRVAAGVGGFRRLAETGGALLEPWLERVVDLSAQMWIDADGGLTLLGTTELLVDGSGLYRGHRGTIDRRGRVTSGHDCDEELREAAAAVARAAMARGYRGPCGVDAFVFRADGRERLRPVVELNARFTLGIVVLGLLRRALGRLRRGLLARGGERHAFFFGLAPPRDRWPRADDGLLMPLWDPRAGAVGPALLFGADREAIDQQLALDALASSDDPVA